MTREKARNGLSWDGAGGVRTPRFQLKPTAHGSGYVDGAWWPRTDDLMAELPDLIAVLSVRQGTIVRVTYHFDEWRMTPAELNAGGRVVQLDGFRGQPPNTVDVVDAEGNKVVLLVVPFRIDPDQAFAIVTAAAAPGNVSRVDTLLMISVKDRESRTKRDAARERWDSQGRAEQPKRLSSTPDPAAAFSGAFTAWQRPHRTMT